MVDWDCVQYGCRWGTLNRCQRSTFASLNLSSFERTDLRCICAISVVVEFARRTIGGQARICPLPSSRDHSVSRTIAKQSTIRWLVALTSSCSFAGSCNAVGIHFSRPTLVTTHHCDRRISTRCINSIFLHDLGCDHTDSFLFTRALWSLITVDCVEDRGFAFQCFPKVSVAGIEQNVSSRRIRRSGFQIRQEV